MNGRGGAAEIGKQNQVTGEIDTVVRGKSEASGGAISVAARFRQTREAKKQRALAGVLETGILIVVIGVLLFQQPVWPLLSITGGWLFVGGWLTMSTVDIDLGDLARNRPVLVHCISIFLMGIVLLAGRLATAFVALPPLYALLRWKVWACGRSKGYLSVVIAWFVLFAACSGVDYYLEADVVAGAIRIAGAVCMCFLWAWAKWLKGMRDTETFWLTVYSFMVIDGVGTITRCVFDSINAGSVSLVAAGAILTVPVPVPLVVFWYRKSLFSHMCRHFEGEQRLEDGA